MLTIDTLAKVILNNCKDVSNKKLQKLAYYIYAWYYTIYNCEIVSMNFEAWEHGPVCRELYNMYKKYGWKTIPQYFGFVLADEEKIRFIRAVLNVYGEFSADNLEQMTHDENPWKICRIGCSQHASSNKVISKELMRSFYVEQSEIKNSILRMVSDEI